MFTLEPVSIVNRKPVTRANLKPRDDAATVPRRAMLTKEPAFVATEAIAGVVVDMVQKLRSLA